VERSLAVTVVSLVMRFTRKEKPLGTNESVKPVAISVVDPVELASFCRIGIGIRGVPDADLNPFQSYARVNKKISRKFYYTVQNSYE
jgi:hypothetical protein